MTNKNIRPCQAESGAKQSGYYAELRAAAQRARLLDALNVSPVTTLEARRNLDVLAPAARIFELRKQGHAIIATRVRQKTENGVLHNVAMYSLVKGCDD